MAAAAALFANSVLRAAIVEQLDNADRWALDYVLQRVKTTTFPRIGPRVPKRRCTFAYYVWLSRLCALERCCRSWLKPLFDGLDDETAVTVLRDTVDYARPALADYIFGVLSPSQRTFFHRFSPSTILLGRILLHQNLSDFRFVWTRLLSAEQRQAILCCGGGKSPPLTALLLDHELPAFHVEYLAQTEPTLERPTTLTFFYACMRSGRYRASPRACALYYYWLLTPLERDSLGPRETSYINCLRLRHKNG